MNALQDGNGFVSNYLPMDELLLNDSSEVMLCDFTSGVQVVSFSNLVSRGLVEPIMWIREAFSTESLTGEILR